MLLYQNVQTDNLPLTVELITFGVNKEYTDPGSHASILMAAKKAEQPLQVELLKNNGFALSAGESVTEEPAEPAAPETDVPVTYHKVPQNTHKQNGTQAQQRLKHC